MSYLLIGEMHKYITCIAETKNLCTWFNDCIYIGITLMLHFHLFVFSLKVLFNVFASEH